jgi:hypothetical protein
MIAEMIKTSSSLFVNFCPVTLPELELPASWVVERPPAYVVLWGFCRMQDALAAKRFLDSLEVNWEDDRTKVWAKLHSLGYVDREALHRAACERLAW